MPDDPTIRLAKFLQDRLNSEQRSYLESVFRMNRYSGGFDLELVEYCLERDPIELLREMFAKPGLMKICAEVTNKTASGLLNFSEDDLAQRVLGALGFSTVSRVRGIVDARDDIEKAGSKLSAATEMTLIRGAIVDGARTFERIAGELLALYASVLFGRPWYNGLKSRGLLSEEAIPTRLSLGSVIDALVRLDGFLVKRTELVAWTRWRELVGGKPILGNVGAKAQNVTKVRNDVAHYRDYVEKMNLPELRELGDTMFKEVLLPLVRYIETEGVYPRIIVVREYVRDAYGRHFVNAEDDRGERHKIFTTEILIRVSVTSCSRERIALLFILCWSRDPNRSKNRGAPLISRLQARFGFRLVAKRVNQAVLQVQFRNSRMGLGMLQGPYSLRGLMGWTQPSGHFS